MRERTSNICVGDIELSSRGFHGVDVFRPSPFESDGGQTKRLIDVSAKGLSAGTKAIDCDDVALTL